MSKSSCAARAASGIVTRPLPDASSRMRRGLMTCTRRRRSRPTSFWWAAIASMATSATFHLMGNRETSVFVGQWAPAFLILGLYNKLVKQLGSDYADRGARA